MRGWMTRSPSRASDGELSSDFTHRLLENTDRRRTGRQPEQVEEIGVEVDVLSRCVVVNAGALKYVRRHRAGIKADQ